MLHDKNTTSYLEELMSVAKVMRHSAFKKPLLTRKEILENAINAASTKPMKIMYLIQHENDSFVCGICENNRRDLYLRLDEETDPLGYTKFWFTPVSYDGLCETIPLDSFQFEGCNTPNKEGVHWWTE